MFNFGASKSATPSLFGSASTAQKPATSFGTSFGAPSLGSTLTQPAPSLGSTMSISMAPTVAAQNIQASTRFNDLPEEIQKKLEELNQTHNAQTLNLDDVSEAVLDVHKELEIASQKYLNTKVTLERDAQHVTKLKASTMRELDIEEMAGRIFDKMMKQGGPGKVTVAEQTWFHAHDFIWKYFQELAAAMEAKAANYQAMLIELERHFVSVYQQSMESQTKISPQLVIEILKNNYQTFLALSARVAEIHEDIERHKQLYAKWRRLVLGDEKKQIDVTKKKMLGASFLGQSTYEDMAKRISTSSSLQPQQQGTTMQQPAASVIGMFGSSTQQKPGGLFGATQPSAGLFGASTAATSQPLGVSTVNAQPSTTVFGAPSTGTSQPSSGLFGTAKPATGGLFGSTTATSQPSTGLFGAAPATSQPATFGGFGSTTTTSQPATTGGFGGFGSSAATSQPTSSFSFGQNASQPSTFGGFGQSAASKPFFSK